MRKPLRIRRIDPHRGVELTSGVLGVIRNLWRDSRAKVTEASAGKPRLDSISIEVGVLIFCLCGFSLNLGHLIGKAPSDHATLRDELDVLIPAVLILCW